MAEKINREITTSFTLPESALTTLRSAVAAAVAAGVKDGFKNYQKQAEAANKKARKKALPQSAATGREEGSRAASDVVNTGSLSRLGRAARQISGASDKVEKAKSGAAKVAVAATGEEVKAKLKLANSSADSVKGIKSLGAALKLVGKAAALAAVAIDSFMRMMNKVETMSKQMVGMSSLFTDKGTMQMMQRTGQTASQATGTQRALDMLGISMEDIQSGYITPAQMATFEKLRLEQIKSIESANEASKSMFETWQKFAVVISNLSAKLGDAFVRVLGKSGAVERLVEAVSPIVDIVFQIIEALMPIIPMLLDLVSAILPSLTSTFGRLYKVIVPIIKIVQWLVDLILVIISPLIQLLDAVNRVSDWVLDVVGGLLGIKSPSTSNNSPQQSVNYNGQNTNTNTTVNNYNQPNNNLYSNEYLFAN